MRKHGNINFSGTETKTDVFYDMLCESRLRELIRSVHLFLDIYPYVVGRVSLVLQLEL